MDVRTVVEHNAWHTPEGVYLRLVVVKSCPDGEERLVVEGADLVLYTCEEVPLRDVAAAYRFFERIGLSAELIYGESSRVKVFRVRGDYEKVVAAITASAVVSEAPSWAQS
ncbi:MAG: hypothetical protein ACP5I3_04825 [Thermoproteus sp.]